MSSQPLRVVLYSHDSQGLGHLRRNLAIAHHLARDLPAQTGRELTGLIISGLPSTGSFPLPSGFDWLTLPGVAKGREGYQPRNLLGGTGSLIALRSGLLEAALSCFDPDLAIIDRHIFGVWQELRAPLQQLRATNPDVKVVLGLREVLDEPATVLAEWRRLGDPGLLRSIVDDIWIYGDPAIHDSVAAGDVPAQLVDRARFTGYLANGRRIAERGIDPGPEPFILTTAGGGSDGELLLSAAATIQPPEGYRHIVVGGPQLDHESLTAISESAPPGTQVHHSWAGMSTLIDHASAVITMGGYNTVCEILATDTPALVVPRETPRLEQLIRAEALQRAGVVDLLRSDQLSANRLGQWAAAAVHRKVGRHQVDRDGLNEVVRFAAELLQARPRLVGGLS